ncbi:AGAP009030-PA, partial [Anopheles gambiae str. PEST]
QNVSSVFAGEIDRCLKKVTEGVETFEDIWQKVHNATNSNQKVCEKYEADLKKEIKKLQRLRDQIKSWIASGEIKDKSALLENRRLIETQMERFKVVERETKTKAYSKEGLGAAQKMDPAQREKEEISTWLTSSITSLQIQIDQFECEVESLLAGKKKKLDKDKQDKMDELKGKLERHKFHVTKLETLLRMLDNDGVEVEQIKKIKEDVEYYIDSSQEPDFEENEYIYDDIIGLDDVEISGNFFVFRNNSNETAGSPSSLISGTSPAQSPVLNYSASTLHNHSSDLSADNNNLNEKRSKSEGTKITVTKTTRMLPRRYPPCWCYRSRPTVYRSSGPLLLPLQNNIPVSIFEWKRERERKKMRTLCVHMKEIALLLSTGYWSCVALMDSFFSLSFLLENGSILQPSTPTTGAGASSASSTSGPLQTQAPNSSNIPPGQNSMLLHNALSSASSTESNNHVMSTSSASTISSSGANVINNCVSPSNSAVITAFSSNFGFSLCPLFPVFVFVVVLTTLSPTSSPTFTPYTHPKHNDAVLCNTCVCVCVLAHVNDSLMLFPCSFSCSLVHLGVAQEAGPVPSNQTPQPQSGGGGGGGAGQSLMVDASGVPAGANAGNNLLPTSSATAAITNGPNTIINTNSSISNAANVNSAGGGGGGGPGGMKPSAGTHEACIPPLLGVAPLGTSKLQKEHQIQFQLMEAAYYHLPTPSDSERLRPYLQRQPVQTPPHYPQQQLPHSETVEFFQRLSPETLFFVFYYMEGTKAQYLAAKALKKQSWRFHTKYMMWFQRHEEPKVINEEYEQGTYIYFDYEKWGQRKKEGFTFEYKYLEDRDLN